MPNRTIFIRDSSPAGLAIFAAMSSRVPSKKADKNTSMALLNGKAITGTELLEAVAVAQFLHLPKLAEQLKGVKVSLPSSAPARTGRVTEFAFRLITVINFLLLIKVLVHLELFPEMSTAGLTGFSVNAQV